MSLREDFNSWLEQEKTELVDFLRHFISYQSIREQEAQLQREFIIPFLSSELKLDQVDEVTVDEDNKRPNVNGVLLGKEGGKNLLFNGHIDVVSAPPRQRKKWKTDPFQPVIKKGRLYGRGAVDMKGPITALFWAIKGFLELGLRPDGDILLNLVVGEETCEQSLGVIPSVKSLLSRREGIDFCLNVEPTGLEIHTVSNGNYDFSIEIQGKAIHTSQKMMADYPQRYGLPSGAEVGIDAGLILAEVLQRLKSLEHRWNMTYRHPLLGGGGWPVPIDCQGTGNTSLNCTLIRAGDYLGSLPGDASIEGQIYYPVNADPEVLQREMEEVLQGVTLAFPGLDKDSISVCYEKRWHWRPFETSRDHEGCQLLARVIEDQGQQPIFSGMRSVLDNTYLAEMGIPVISCGPGYLSDGTHGPNESIELESIYQAALIYFDYMVRWSCSNN